MKPYLYGPRPVSALFAVEDGAGRYDTATGRAEVIIDGDGLAVCWRLWTCANGTWTSGTWDLRTSREELQARLVGGAA